MDEPEVTGRMAELLAEAHAGSAPALGELMEACRPYLLWLANRELEAAVRSKGGASDLVQETFLRAQGGFARFHGDTERELLAWLRRLLLNNLANFRRQYHEAEKRQVSREQRLDTERSGEKAHTQIAAATQSPSSIWMQEEQAERLVTAVARLPEDYRLVVHLRYWEQRSFEEIGRLMFRSPDAARKLWARAIQRLQTDLDSSDEAG